MGRRVRLLPTTRVALTTSPPSNSYVTPATTWPDVSGFQIALVMVHITDWSGAGNLEIDVQSALYAARDDNAWVTVLSKTGITANGAYLVAQKFSYPITGVLRIKAVCTTSAIGFNMRAELVLKQQCESQFTDWLAPTVLTLSNSSWAMDSDIVADCSRFLNAYTLVEFQGTSSGTLTAALETAPSTSSDANAWIQVATATLSSTAVQLNGELSASVPPMGAVRLKLTNSSGTSTGTFRASLLTKEV